MLMMNDYKNKQVVFLTALLFLIMIVVVLFATLNDKTKPTLNVPESGTVVITKDAYQKMVQDGADKKYIQDVLGGKPESKLPLPKGKTPLQPYPNPPIVSQQAVPSDITAVQPVQNSVSLNQNAMKAISDNQHCMYKGDSYSLGEIVQIDKGWVRCTPTINVSADGSSVYGAAAWTLRDSLM